MGVDPYLARDPSQQLAQGHWPTHMPLVLQNERPCLGLAVGMVKCHMKHIPHENKEYTLNLKQKIFLGKQQAHHSYEGFLSIVDIHPVCSILL